MTSRRVQATVGLLTLVLATLAVPVVIPIANKVRSVKALPPTYLPALEGPRERGRFEERRISELHYLQPGYVVIGDSMAGTRIDDRRLGELARTPIAPLLQPGSGPAFWYLALKNWVIPSKITPRLVFIFFRDTNLTDVLFRLEPQFRWSLDLAALDREEELNAIVARAIDPLHRVHVFLARDLGVEQAREWAEPALTNWPAEVIEPLASPSPVIRSTPTGTDPSTSSSVRCSSMGGSTGEPGRAATTWIVYAPKSDQGDASLKALT